LRYGGSSSKSPTSKSRSRAGSKRKAQRPATPAINLTLDQRLDILGILLALGGILTLLSLLSASQGFLTGWWLGILRETFGWGVFAVPLVLMATGGWLLLRNFDKVPRPSGERIIGFGLAFLVALLTLQVVAVELQNGIPPAEVGGGRIGEWLRQTLVVAIGGPGTDARARSLNYRYEVRQPGRPQTRLSDGGAT